MGKSYRSAQLAELGFKTACCDDLIAAEIAELLPSRDVGGLAAWMGQPYAPGFAEREAEYLSLEERVTSQVLVTVDGNMLIDTTGSVIYLPPSMLGQLTARTFVVYLESSPEARQAMFEIFLQDPKPVVWKDSFRQKEGETERDALIRCYPELLTYRADQYRVLADVILPYSVARDPHSSGEQFLAAIVERLA